MKKNRTLLKLINSVIFGALIVFIFIFISANTDLFESGYHGMIKDFSEGWINETGEEVDLDKINTGSKGYDGEIVVEKTIPNNISDDDALCFESRNANIIVYIDTREVYSFKGRENLTGAGYGTAFHDVGLCTDDAGCRMRVICVSVDKDVTEAYLSNMHLCSASDFFRMNIKAMLIPALISFITLFFGIALVVVYIWMPNREILPFNILALAAIASIFGFTLLLDTNILQLMTGTIYIWRDLSRIVIFLVMYPVIAFLNSLTEQKRPIYDYISFTLSVLSIVFIISIRYLYNIDMAVSYSRVLIAYAIISAILMTVITRDNSIYCKAFGVKNELRVFFAGLGILVVCGLFDMLYYVVFNKSKSSYANATRIGILLFLMVMMFEFLKWWTKDHQEIERDRFINHALQFAVSSDTPEVSIRSLIEYLGTEFKARRFFIFEDQKNGKFRGTYEWFREGEKSAGLDIMYIPYSGVIDKLYDSFNKNDHRLIITDLEQYKTANPAFYNILNTNRIDNLVMGPLEVNGNLIGVCGVLGAPPETLDGIAEIISLISYFLAQLILQREEQKRLFYYSYNDGLSGAMNLRAYRKFVGEGLDLSGAFGYMRINIEGLVAINKTYGYEAGDKIVLDVAKCLMEVFGKENVYRMNGTEFVCIGFETEEVFFYNDVDRAKKLIEEKDINGIRITSGAVYCVYGTTDLDIVTERVEELMQADAQPDAKPDTKSAGHRIMR